MCPYRKSMLVLAPGQTSSLTRADQGEDRPRLERKLEPARERHQGEDTQAGPVVRRSSPDFAHVTLSESLKLS